MTRSGQHKTRRCMPTILNKPFKLDASFIHLVWGKWKQFLGWKIR